MRRPRVRLLKLGMFLVGALALAGISAAAWPHVAGPDWSVKEWWTKLSQNADPSSTDRGSSAALVSERVDCLQLPAEVARKLGVQTEVVRAATQPRILELSGTLALDTDHLSRIHSPFPGEVVEIEDLQGVSEN